MSENGNPVPRVIPLNEIIASAVINIPGIHYDSLSKMLSSALKNEEALAQIHNLDFIETETSAPEEIPPPAETDLLEPEVL
jgi:hypothetical protein